MPETTATRPRWKLRNTDPALVAALARRHGLSPFAATVLAARGPHGEPELRRHLEPRLADLHDPFLLPGMRRATERIAQAIVSGETILVHGDYDVDGVTGTALLVRLLAKLGAKVAWHIPNRFTDGYSFGAHSVEKARACGATLVISVDNGTSAREVIAELLRLGVDTIVTDHHEPPRGELPPAVAIVNPKLDGSAYPFRELCGGAVAFKLAWGLCQEVSGAARVRPDLRDFLVDAMALVALATVCDVVPLVDENRILAVYGLRSLAATRQAGLAALRRAAELDGRALLAEDVAFKLGPRINASGRMGSAHRAVDLLLADDAVAAQELARELELANAERKRIERELFETARAAAEPYADARAHPFLVIAGEGWHPGVIGIIAARLAETFLRPALVIGHDGAVGRGSARTAGGIDLLDVLHAGAPHMLRYGGHAQAAGCEVRADAVDGLREALRARAGEIAAGRGPAEAAIWFDCEVPLQHVDRGLMAELERLGPFGARNEKPVFRSSDLRLAEPPRVLGSEGQHLVLQVRRGAQVHKAVAFGRGARAGELELGVPIDLVHTPRWNVFRGETRLELEVADFAAGAARGDRPSAARDD